MPDESHERDADKGGRERGPDPAQALRDSAARLWQAGNRMAEMATEKAMSQWDRLEAQLEERVTRALQRRGVPSREEVDDLKARVATLERELARGRTRRPPGAEDPEEPME